MKLFILILLFFALIGNTLQAQSSNETVNKIKDGLRRVMVSKWTKLN